MRTLAAFAGAFSLGIFLSQYLLPHNWLLLWGAAAFVLSCGALLLPGIWRRRVLLAGVALAIAFGYNWIYVRQVQRPMENLAGTKQAVSMTLYDYATATDYGAKVTVKVEGLPGKVVYYGEESLLELSPGQSVETYVEFQSAARIRDDDITTFTSKGVFLLAYSRGEALYGAGSSASSRWWPVRLGQAMRRQINELFQGDTAAFLTAILTGDKSGLSEKAAIAMSESGVYHILAVSGMHCMFLVSVIISVFGKHRKRLVAAWALPLMAFYALLTGGSPSIVRACIMVAFYLSAPLFRRDSDGPTALSAALMLILLANPFAAASVSLQLSFAAMAGILLVTPRLEKMLFAGKKHGKVFSFTASGFSSTMGALAFSVPLSAYYFGYLSLVSPLSNLLCLWAASIVFTLGLAAVLLSFLWMPLAMVLGLVPKALIWYILFVTQLLSDLPYHAVYFSNEYLKYWLAFAYLLFAVVFVSHRKRARSYGLAAGLTLLTLVASIVLGALRYEDGRLHVFALDVGQGQSVLLSSKGTSALVDCGSANSWYDPGRIAADYLLSMGHNTLDHLVLTHYDSDHVNGITALMERIDVDTLYAPDMVDEGGLRELVAKTAKNYGTKLIYLEEIAALELGAAQLTLYPPVGTGEDNESGLSVLCSGGEYDLLITGDMDSATERMLLERYALPDVEALAVGHHGSKYSTSKELLDMLTPETALISVGSNSYGHPTDETLRRLVSREAAICRTDLQGTIYLKVN